MATYEFKCVSCGTIFTVARNMTTYDPKRPPKCPQCGGRNVFRIYSHVYAKTAKKS